MLFQDVLGQAGLKNKIIHLIHEKHLPHAILLTAKEGSGGLPLALAMAQYIQCEQPQETDSCGQCSACIKVQKLQHPDVHFSFPTIKKGNSDNPPVSSDWMAEFRSFVLAQPYGDEQDWLQTLAAEKQANITAAECRDIIRKLTLRSFESEFKVLIQWYPERLGNEGNILLKLIEEPTPNTILIFVCAQPERVLATIQSRTQLFALEPLTVHEIKDKLIATGTEPDSALQIARLADGNYNKALQLSLDQGSELINWFRMWLNALYTNKGLDLVEWVNTLADETKENQKKFLHYTLSMFEYYLRYKVLGRDSVALLESEYRVMENLTSRELGSFAVENMSQQLNKAIQELERNANSKILFHSLSLRVQQILLHHKKAQQQVA